MATKHKRATMTARQLAEDYLAHQITRDVTRTSTRHHLNQLLTRPCCCVSISTHATG